MKVLGREIHHVRPCGGLIRDGGCTKCNRSFSTWERFIGFGHFYSVKGGKNRSARRRGKLIDKINAGELRKGYPGWTNILPDQAIMFAEVLPKFSLWFKIGILIVIGIVSAYITTLVV